MAWYAELKRRKQLEIEEFEPDMRRYFYQLWVTTEGVLSHVKKNKKGEKKPASRKFVHYFITFGSLGS